MKVTVTQAFYVAACQGDKAKVFINDGAQLRPHSNCLFTTICGCVCVCVCPLDPETYLSQVCVQNHIFFKRISCT